MSTTTDTSTSSPDEVDGGGGEAAPSLMDGLKALSPETPRPPGAPGAPERHDPEPVPGDPAVTSEAVPGDDVRSGDDRVDKIMQSWKDAAGSADMEVYRPTLMPTASTWAGITRIAEDLSRAMSLPPALREKPADISLVLLVGRDVGVGPTTALNKIYVIDGKPSMAPELMRALLVERGHDCWFEDLTHTSVTFCAHRSNWPESRVTRVTWTLDDARSAGLIIDYDPATGKVTASDKKKVWERYTRSMLKARATSELCRDDFADVLLGVSYTPEELDADVDESGALLVQADAWTTNSTNAPVYQPAPDVVLAAFQAEIDAMDETTRKALSVKWKENKIRPLRAPGPESKLPPDSWMRQVLAMDEIDLAAVTIAEVKRNVAVEAEIVSEDGTEPCEAQEDTGTAGGPENDAQAGETGTEKAARVAATVADLAPSQVTEVLGRLATPIESAESATDEERRTMLVQVMMGREDCPVCGALTAGDPMDGEALCGGHEEGRA